MPDKLTDSEIVKALECCAEKVDYEGYESTCCSCSLITDNSCNCTLAKLSLDLINRLQAENERVYADIMTYKLRRARATAKLNAAKAEAYKEFDECLKEDCLSYPLETEDITMLVNVDRYNNLLKELVGEDNESTN